MNEVKNLNVCVFLKEKKECLLAFFLFVKLLLYLLFRKLPRLRHEFVHEFEC